MLPPDVEIVGAVVEITEDDVLVLRLMLDDGGVAATHWPLATIAEFAERIRESTHAPPTVPLH